MKKKKKFEMCAALNLARARRDASPGPVVVSSARRRLRRGGSDTARTAFGGGRGGVSRGACLSTHGAKTFPRVDEMRHLVDGASRERLESISLSAAPADAPREAAAAGVLSLRRARLAAVSVRRRAVAVGSCSRWRGEVGVGSGRAMAGRDAPPAIDL